MADDIPTWALERVIQEIGVDWKVYQIKESFVYQAFARYIAAHEEPPVDPLETEAQRLLEEYWYNSDQSTKDLVTAALRRGIEIGESM